MKGELIDQWADYARARVTEVAIGFLALKEYESHTIHLREGVYAPPGKKVIVTFEVVDEEWDE